MKGQNGNTSEYPIRGISAEILAAWMQEKREFQLIDVREPYEYDISNIGGTLIPKSQIQEQTDQISKAKPVVIHCRSGKRSADAIALLQEQFGYDNLYKFEGGILAFAEEVDQSLAKN